MGNKYYVFHGLLSQMSRFVQQGHRHEDLGLGVAVTSIYQLPISCLLGNSLATYVAWSFLQTGLRWVRAGITDSFCELKMMRREAVAEQNTEQQIQIRQVTDVHANWTYDGELEDGKFSYQLILDNGAEEAVVLPSPESAEVLEELIQDAETLYWDTQNQVLIFSKLK
jgi:hypothetical protein